MIIGYAQNIIVMPNRGKNKYISKNFQRDDIGLTISKEENKNPELSVEVAIPLDDVDVPELEALPEKTKAKGSLPDNILS